MPAANLDATLKREAKLTSIINDCLCSLDTKGSERLCRLRHHHNCSVLVIVMPKRKISATKGQQNNDEGSTPTHIRLTRSTPSRKRLIENDGHHTSAESSNRTTPSPAKKRNVRAKAHGDAETGQKSKTEQTIRTEKEVTRAGNVLVDVTDVKVVERTKTEEIGNGTSGLSAAVKVEVSDTKVKRKRKTKEEKEAEAMPLAARTVGHKLYVGAHVSASGG